MKKFVFLFILTIFSANVFASSDALVSKIEIQGLERIHPDMIYNIINIKSGDSVNNKKLNSALTSLYNTGYFNDIKLNVLDNGNLIIKVSENPIIGAVAFEGNSAIKVEDLQKDIKTRSRVIFNPSQIKQDVETIKTPTKK